MHSNGKCDRSQASGMGDQDARTTKTWLLIVSLARHSMNDQEISDTKGASSRFGIFVTVAEIGSRSSAQDAIWIQNSTSSRLEGWSGRAHNHAHILQPFLVL